MIWSHTERRWLPSKYKKPSMGQPKTRHSTVTKLAGKEDRYSKNLHKKVSYSTIARIMGINRATLRHFICNRKLVYGHTYEPHAEEERGTACSSETSRVSAPSRLCTSGNTARPRWTMGQSVLGSRAKISIPHHPENGFDDQAWLAHLPSRLKPILWQKQANILPLGVGKLRHTCQSNGRKRWWLLPGRLTIPALPTQE